MISKTFRAAVKLSELKQYEIARKAGIHHTVLSRIVCGIDEIKKDDPRVLRIAAIVGLEPAACFENEEAIK